MVKIKRIIKRVFFALLVCLACMAPIPIVFRRKDDAPEVLTEQLDEQDKDDQELKELY